MGEVTIDSIQIEIESNNKFAIKIKTVVFHFRIQAFLREEGGFYEVKDGRSLRLYKNTKPSVFIRHLPQSRIRSTAPPGWSLRYTRKDIRFRVCPVGFSEIKVRARGQSRFVPRAPD